MYRSPNWETERFIFEKLKETDVFRYWKKVQFDCQNGQCAWCEKPMQYRRVETDHIKPLYYGGTSEASNLILCHHECNKQKSTKTTFSRPEWIRLNKYDVGVTGKYNSLKKWAQTRDGVGEKREWLVNPVFVPEPKIIYKTVEKNAKTPYLFWKTMAIVGWMLCLSLIAFEHIGEIKTIFTGTSTMVKIQTEDDKRKQFAESVLAGFTAFYNNYMNKPQGMGLLDTQDCSTWIKSGCTLSFYSKITIPDGYTYSINSIENGEVFKQNGKIPHASVKNVALYKRARCGENGTVIGNGNEANAASVVQLESGEYYCVEN